MLQYSPQVNLQGCLIISSLSTLKPEEDLLLSVSEGVDYNGDDVIHVMKGPILSF